jgi:hypothetical protein
MPARSGTEISINMNIAATPDDAVAGRFIKYIRKFVFIPLISFNGVARFYSRANRIVRNIAFITW